MLGNVIPPSELSGRDVEILRDITVPFFRPDIRIEEIEEVAVVLASGWLTSGPCARRFEQAFAEKVGASYAVALNSCTAALHLAVEALGLTAGQAVLVPTMTFAATAEVVRYLGATPILVDCDPVTGNMSLADAERKLDLFKNGKLLDGVPDGAKLVGIIPVHVGGLMMDLDAIHQFAETHGLWVVEDAAHAFPAAWRRSVNDKWQQCGEGTAAVTCFSFYANKTITTGEGGMAVTESEELADRMRLMSLHGLSHEAWGRHSDSSSWDYKIVAPGFKYNLTDIAAAVGVHQLERAEGMRREREYVAHSYIELLNDVAEIELPAEDVNRIQSRHLFPVKLNLERLDVTRDEFILELKQSGVGCSVHWRPLHLHPYYQKTFDWREESFPVATTLWQRLISLPLFSGMTADEIEHVVETIKRLCRKHTL
jgi:dTDP-4-amino-4,6-dideoxygalactose transaminase